MAVQKMSESVYVAMCRKIGTQKQVAIRRDTADIRDWFMNQVQNRPIKHAVLYSGSQREGFRFIESDVDCMCWFTNQSVIWDFHQYKFYNIRRQVLFLCDSFASLPGFTLLLLLSVGDFPVILEPCVRMNGNLYISSSRFKELLENSGNGLSIHGPCLSGKLLDFFDFDIAVCIACDFWPPSAISWIDRCHTWPPISVVNDIVRNGCHFVPIGHKLGIHADKEWRISFSQAEIKLVYSMSHTQFLVYGLLKLFLKEIINKGIKDEDKLLCSYHVKTAVFWAIQQNALSYWCPQNLLTGFWICFKLLLKWVYKGACPNFFIPQNNMFLGKIHGKTQTRLFRRLYDMYKMGISLLLNSPSIRSGMYDVLCNPKLEIFIDEDCLIAKDELDECLLNEINTTMPILDETDLQKYLHMIEQTICLPLTRYKIAWLQKVTGTIFQYIAFTIPHKHKDSNKHEYVVDKMIYQMLRLATKFRYASDLLYIAMYYYKTRKYRKALSIVEQVRGKCLSIKDNLVYRINLKAIVPYIGELIPEQQAARQNRKTNLIILPLVLLHMLEFLCSRHVDTLRAQATLNYLQAKVHNMHTEFGETDSLTFAEISWEILGICQQIAGYHQAALYSYQQSLRQYPMNRIQTATRQRIRDLQI